MPSCRSDPARRPRCERSLPRASLRCSRAGGSGRPPVWCSPVPRQPPTCSPGRRRHAARSTVEAPAGGSTSTERSMRRPTFPAGLIAAACVVAASGCQTMPQPYGSTLVTVDTDVAVPRLVSSLRIDVFRDGAWIESRELPIRDARLLPVSFGIFSSGPLDRSEALVRLRAYGDGALVDAPAAPRLVVGGVDVTPAREPDPAIAVDQLVRVTLIAGEERRARLVLRGACAGIPADVAQALTCADDSGRRRDAPQVADDDAPAGTFGIDALDTPAPRAAAGIDDGGEALVPGGAFVLGSRD